MGYSPFNLTTLQLPVPSSNMTKAEYKDAYGIDLDDINIKAFKLVLYGGEKYTIDQIKEVEDGIEIYFNGRILSITDIVQTSDEVYDVVNSKPIYIHPISLIRSSGSIVYSLGCLIFNNSPEPFTLDSFKSYLNTLYESVGSEVQIMVSGYYKGTDAGVVAYLFKNNASVGLAGYDIASESVKALASNSDFDVVFGTTGITLSDGVNKIN